MKPMSTEEHRTVLLDIASTIHRVCDEHGLVYVLQGGSLLGAIRHGGFIPWDHDFDIMMPRHDYDTLIEHWNEWCDDPKYQMIAPSLKNCPYFFAKVVDTSTYVKQIYIADEYCTGAWVDIFPLDGVHDNVDEIRQKVLHAKRAVYTAITDTSSGSTPLIKAAKKVVTPIWKRIIKPYEMTYKTDQLMRSQSAEPTDALATFSTTHSFLICPIDLIFRRTLVPFEDREYWGPADYEAALVNEFGENWRTPMPDGDHIVKESRYFL